MLPFCTFVGLAAYMCMLTVLRVLDAVRGIRHQLPYTSSSANRRESACAYREERSVFTVVNQGERVHKELRRCFEFPLDRTDVPTPMLPRVLLACHGRRHKTLAEILARGKQPQVWSLVEDYLGTLANRPYLTLDKNVYAAPDIAGSLSDHTLLRVVPEGHMDCLIFHHGPISLLSLVHDDDGNDDKDQYHLPGKNRDHQAANSAPPNEQVAKADLELVLDAWEREAQACDELVRSQNRAAASHPRTQDDPPQSLARPAAATIANLATWLRPGGLLVVANGIRPGWCQHPFVRKYFRLLHPAVLQTGRSCSADAKVDVVLPYLVLERLD
jgi:hypothetical protein